MTKSQELVNPITAEIKRGSCWLICLGVLFLVLGGVGIGMVVGLTLMSMFFFGVLLIIAGITHLIDAFQYKGWKAAFWQALICAFYIAGGCLVIYDPFLASTLITALLAWVLIVIGITRFIMAISLRGSKGWGWLLLAGLTAIILGVLILAQWPISGLWAIGMFIAIELIITGWTYLLIGIAVRNA